MMPTPNNFRISNVIRLVVVNVVVVVVHKVASVRS